MTQQKSAIELALELLSDDAYAATFQTLGQYRSALVRTLKGIPAGTPRTDAQHAKWRIADDPYGAMTAFARQLEAQRNELADALRAVLVMWDYGPQPRKLEEALSWRDNDTKARAMADAALAKCNDSALVHKE